MSTPEKPTSWEAEAQGLAKRYALPSGVVMTFAVFALIVVPSLIRERKPRPRQGSGPQAALSAGWLSQADAPATKGRDLPPVDPATVMTSTPKLLGRGKALFAVNCSSCHGDSGRGDGPASGTLNPRPRNFAETNGWKNGYRVTDIFNTLARGVKGSGMNAFDFIAPADRMALVHYVRSLGAFDHGPEDPTATQSLEDQFRSKGVHIPNRIPVSFAIKKMVAEQSPPPPIHYPSAIDRSASANLLRSAIANPDHVARTVADTKPGRDWQDVARGWTAGAPSNGFAPSVASMTAAEWQEVVGALLGREALTENQPEGQAQP